jgi:eukaryotic-like serine/threonine-protein kinase
MNDITGVEGSGEPRIGRYELLAPIGAAEVTHARDPHLSRNVALRRLRPMDGDRGAGDPARLLGEARMLAQLAHPNIVAVYDVVSRGTEHFIALEHVYGTPLDVWLTQARRRAEIARVLVAAGRGLAAAHAAGVLHRSFTPASVIISVGGRVRVVDFALGDSGAGANPDRGASESAYVAPERRHGQPADARSDQFAYAATVYFGLTRREPDLDTLGGAGPLWPRSVSRRLRRIVERGLHARPEERYASLDAMVSQLERAERARARCIRASTVICATASVGASAFFVSQRHAESPCQLDDSVFDGVWDSARRGTLEQAFQRTGRRNAGEVFGLIAERLDRFRKQWLGVRRLSCEATHVRQEQSDRVMALRAACLDRALAGTKTFIVALEGLDAANVDNIAGAFPASLDACSDTATLLGGAADWLPADAPLRASIEQIERELSDVQALLTAARGPASIERARELLTRAERTGHGPTIAQVNAQLARATYATAATNEQRLRGEAMLKESLVLAARAGDTGAVSRIVSYLFMVIGYGQSRISEAEAMLPMVEALIERAGNRPDQRIELLMGMGEIQKMHAQYPEAIATLDEVSQLAETVQSELHSQAINAALSQGQIFSELGRHEEATAALERAAAGIRRTFGPGHPRLVYALVNVARVQAKAKDLKSALATMRDVHELASTLPSDEPRLKHIPFAEGDVWKDSGNCTRAIPFYRDALARFTAANGAEHAMTLDVAYHLGACLRETRQLHEAADVLERTLAGRRRAGDTPTALAEAAFELAQVHWLAGQPERSTSLASEAAALWRKDGGTNEASEAEAWIAERAPNRIRR